MTSELGGLPPVSLHQLCDLALDAGVIMTNHFSGFGMNRDVKGDLTPVTIADKEINSLVIKRVRRISAEVDIVGEEESARTESEWQVVCDPLDGTFPYTWGMPVSTFMIGLLHSKVPIMGVIYDPFTNRMYSAEKHFGAFVENTRRIKPLRLPLQVANPKERQERPIVGFVSWPECPFNVLQVCQHLEDAGVTLVNFCSIGYIEAAVATGEFAATLFPGTAHHDTAPGHIIVEEAGGKVTDVFGQPLHYTDGKIKGHIMSNGGLIHDLIVETVLACQ